jgi:flagellar protein FlbD
MIRLTRLNSQPLIVNSDLIKFIEAAPDTVLTLVNGEKVIVQESEEQILERIVEFRRCLLAVPAHNSPIPPSAPKETPQGSRKTDSPTGARSR